MLRIPGVIIASVYEKINVIAIGYAADGAQC
jgi:hypothetical protein